MKKKEQVTTTERGFEILKHDKLNYQYCGSKSPDTVLHINPIKPVSKGGGNDMLKITSGFDFDMAKKKIKHD